MRRRVHCDWRFLGLGLYVNLARYRYVAIQLGPLWIYLVAAKEILRLVPERETDE